MQKNIILFNWYINNIFGYCIWEGEYTVLSSNNKIYEILACPIRKFKRYSWWDKTDECEDFGIEFDFTNNLVK
jgi:hypothetical protein